MKVYLNGAIVDHEHAAIPVDDRGFLFADGVYEVIRVYGGRQFLADEHLRRLRAGMAALRIDPAGLPDLEDVAQRLIDANAVTEDGTVYIQVTRGVAPRRHAFPEGVTPTVYMMAKPFRNHPAEAFERGVAAITVPDTRWSRCDIKAIALLPNVLANQLAHDAGAFEAIFVRDGVLIEGSHSNLFAVIDNTLLTYPSSNYILTGITRNLVLELARELGINAAEAPVFASQVPDLQELFLSGTTTEVMPVTRLDSQPVASGAPGKIATALQRAYRQRAHSDHGAAIG
jgi:D-alanine transaminase